MNISLTEKNAVVLGWDMNYKKLNFGNDESVIIESGIKGISYNEMMCQFDVLPFWSDRIEFSSSTLKQIHSPIYFFWRDNSRVLCKQKIRRNIKNNTIIDGVIRPFNRYSSFEMALMPSTSLNIDIYPMQRIKI